MQMRIGQAVIEPATWQVDASVAGWVFDPAFQLGERRPSG